MPAIWLDRLPLPSLAWYSVLSVGLFSASVLFAIRTISSAPDWREHITDEHSSSLWEPPTWLEICIPFVEKNVTAAEVTTFMIRESRCIWTLINMVYCLLILFGHWIQQLVFGELRVLEAQQLKDKFWNFVFYKFIFIFGVMSVQHMHQVILWCSWFSALGFLLLMTQLCQDRFEYLCLAAPDIQARHIRLLGLLLCNTIASFILFGICVFVGLHSGWHVFAFMAAESIMLLIRTLHVVARYAVHLWDVRQRISFEACSFIVYSINFVFELVGLSVDLVHHLHMLFWGNMFVSMASLVVCMQLRYLYYAICSRLYYHRLRTKILAHLISTYPEITCNDRLSICAICWDPLGPGVARQLPCSHVFHLYCLLSWLEQDASCPTCRRTLDITKEGSPVHRRPRMLSWLPSFTVEITPSQMLQERTRHAGRSGGAHTRAMAREIQELFPNLSRITIEEDLRRTGSADQTVENILEGYLTTPVAQHSPLFQTNSSHSPEPSSYGRRSEAVTRPPSSHSPLGFQDVVSDSVVDSVSSNLRSEDGRLDDEDEVLAWLTDSDNLEIEDQIEAVNAKMLSKLIENEEHLAVLFYVEGEKRSEKVLHELENIDDECEATDIDFVRIADTKAAKEYGLSLLPAMIFFTRKFPQVYEGDLTQEEKVLEWLLERKGATPKNDVIDLVDRKQLQRLIDDYENTAVFFYEKACRKECEEILEGLETIDDDAEEQGIRFVKIPDVDFAKQIGITEFPSLVYFEEKIPSIFDGDLLDYEAILDWLVYQKVEDTIENINREMLDNLIKTQEFLAVFFSDIEDNQDCVRSLKKMETIDDEATEFGITIVKMNDNLMAKKYGIRRPPGIVYFRKGKHIKYDGDIMDQEEVLEWLTDPDNMELTDHIEKVNRKMFEKIKERADYLAVFFYSDSKCKQCEKVLNEIENIDDEAANAGIEFVKVDDPRLAKEHGVHALPALLYFRRGSEEPIIYAGTAQVAIRMTKFYPRDNCSHRAGKVGKVRIQKTNGDLKNEERILEWLLAEKDPSGDIIEDMSGDKLRKLISKSESVAVYFCHGLRVESTPATIAGSEFHRRRDHRSKDERGRH
ncbi:unnamed protein product [Cyprideis torosa]|uniref:Uncharacterized protein n=1 Tax=Cyprideis torosa TaxID=163714 RepID=A0A7R8WFT9_9CRUS|nr:unnamed protein product [Cyprideis torosa]CAG0890984.1 unnamed protein product [Cyprideis torosa]